MYGLPVRTRVKLRRLCVRLLARVPARGPEFHIIVSFFQGGGGGIRRRALGIRPSPWKIDCGKEMVSLLQDMPRKARKAEEKHKQKVE